MQFIQSFLKILLSAAAIIFMMFYPFITRLMASLTVLAFFKYAFTGTGQGYALAFFLAFIGTKLIVLSPLSSPNKSIR